MVYARQTDDFVVKNIKKHNFLDIYDVITQNDVILCFLTEHHQISQKILHKLGYDLLGKHTPNEAKKGMKDNFCLKNTKNDKKCQLYDVIMTSR